MKNKSETQPCPFTDSVLFQLILMEFLRASKELSRVEKLLIQELSNSAKPYRSLQLIFQSEKIFSGSKTSSGRAYGILTLEKLKDYSLWFQQDGRQKDLLNFKKLSLKGWLLGIELGELIENSLCTKQFGKKLTQLIKTVRSLQQPVMKLISQFCDDENVILFLVKHQCSLDGVFGQGFTVNQLRHMHKSVKESGQFLLKSFAKRRFDQLLPAITQKIAALESLP